MKTKEELNALKEEIETLTNKLKELSEEELAQTGGGQDLHDKSTLRICDLCGQPIYPGITYGEHLYGYHATARLEKTPRGLKQPDDR